MLLHSLLNILLIVQEMEETQDVMVVTIKMLSPTLQQMVSQPQLINHTKLFNQHANQQELSINQTKVTKILPQRASLPFNQLLQFNQSQLLFKPIKQYFKTINQELLAADVEQVLIMLFQQLVMTLLVFKPKILGVLPGDKVVYSG